ncbi:MAG TPA: 3'-5' exonuclease, partial [Burkholderiaceae bacterium]|nr:3'-5' exonuclease [Burkholderiaceae bacterium]
DAPAAEAEAVATAADPIAAGAEADPSDDDDADEQPAPASEGPPRRWWPRLKAIAAAPDPADPPPFDAPAIVERLARWIDEAARWPVHDFLDALLAQVDAFSRYPAAVEPAQREVAHANLCAMLGLALDVDAGRFPSLARFLRRLRGFDTLDDREGPSEGRGDAVDAIRLMTIHASKGLEAEIVVLADAHHGGRAEGLRLHVDWSPERPRPTHLSFVLDKALVGRARSESFERDAELREREDRNLLYVAITRAKAGVIVSGIQSRNAPKESWYTYLDGVSAPPGVDAAPAADAATPDAAGPASDEFELRLLHLPRLDVGERRAPGADERDERGEPASLLATELGHAMHRALELLPDGHDEPTVLAALHAFALDGAQRRRALERARAVLALPALAPAFDRAAPAACEAEILDDAGEPRRIDRLVRVGDALWIVDYKWSVDDGRRAEYLAQLAEYRDLVSRLRPAPFGAPGPVVTLLVDAATGRVERDPDAIAGRTAAD